MTKLICIVCPKGCRLQVDEANGFSVTGNECKRGEVYGKKELQNPTRVLTSTVQLEGAFLRRLPVKADKELPKKDIETAVRELNGIIAHAPVKIGDIIVENLLGSGVNIVATRSFGKTN